RVALTLVRSGLVNANRTKVSSSIGYQDTLVAVERLLLNVIDVERSRDLVNRDRRRNITELPMDLAHEPFESRGDIVDRHAVKGDWRHVLFCGAGRTGSYHRRSDARQGQDLPPGGTSWQILGRRLWHQCPHPPETLPTPGNGPPVPG